MTSSDVFWRELSLAIQETLLLKNPTVGTRTVQEHVSSAVAVLRSGLESQVGLKISGAMPGEAAAYYSATDYCPHSLSLHGIDTAYLR